MSGLYNLWRECLVSEITSREKNTELLKCLFSVLLKMYLTRQWNNFLWPQVAYGKGSSFHTVSCCPETSRLNWSVRLIAPCRFTPLEGYVPYV